MSAGYGSSSIYSSLDRETDIRELLSKIEDNRESLTPSRVGRTSLAFWVSTVTII